MKSVALSTIFLLGFGNGQKTGLILTPDEEDLLDLPEITVRGMHLHARVGGSVPASLNLASKLPPVKQQGGCGSCWAFAAADALAGRHMMKNNQRVDISEKHLLDCTYPASYNGCGGGNSGSAWKNVASKGVAAQNKYHSYDARDGTCPSDDEFNSMGFERKAWAGSSESDLVVHQFFSGKQDLKEELFKYGPCVMYMGVDNAFQRLGTGIWRCGSKRINHAITLVGYGRENGENYWMIKNSWGTGWGDNGFGRISMDHCAMGSSTGVIMKCPEVRRVEFTLSGSSESCMNGVFTRSGTKNGAPSFVNSYGGVVKYENTEDDWGYKNLCGRKGCWTTACGGHHRHFSVSNEKRIVHGMKWRNRAGLASGTVQTVLRPQEVEVVVGTSASNSKTVDADVTDCPVIVDQTNWLGGARHGDRFSVMVSNGKVTVTRKDSDSGWGMDLRFKCMKKGAFTLSGSSESCMNGVFTKSGTKNGAPSFVNSHGGVVEYENTENDWGYKNLCGRKGCWTMACGGHHRHFSVSDEKKIVSGMKWSNRAGLASGTVQTVLNGGRRLEVEAGSLMKRLAAAEMQSENESADVTA